MASCKPPIWRLACPDFNPKFPNQLRNSGLGHHHSSFSTRDGDRSKNPPSSVVARFPITAFVGSWPKREMLLPTTLDSLAPTSRQVGFSETGLGAPRQVLPYSDTAIVGGSPTPWGGNFSAP